MERVVRAYVAGLNDRDGARVCSLFAPGAIDSLELPVRRGGCAPSLEASIGYRNPRAPLVWRSARIELVRSIDVQGDSARATVAMFTAFANNREPSIEDDIVYLSKVDGRWLIAKPSTTIHRAVGIADIPPSVIAPP